MTVKFQHYWRVMRWTAVLIGGILIVWVSVAHAWNLEIEYVGPGSEAERLNEACRERDNREANDRCNAGTDRPGDAARANEYDRDHAA